MWTYIQGAAPLTRMAAHRLLWTGLIFILVGILILLFPQLLAVPIAILCLIIGFSLISGGIRAWLVWYRLRRQQNVQDASWHEVD